MLASPIFWADTVYMAQETPDQLKEVLRSPFMDLFGSESTDQVMLGAYFDTVTNHYSQEHRAYHTLRHVYDLLALEKSGILAVQDPETVRAAIWLHDVVYKQQTKKGYNERKSAQFSDITLRALGRYDLVNNTNDLIIATIEHQPVGSHPDVEAFLDMDLSILGAEPARYDQYAEAIRFEYNYIPEADYRTGRAAVLQTFRDRLSEGGLFYTPEAFDAFAENADANMEREIYELAA